MKPRIVTAWAEHCRGPGWTNSPVWVLLRHPGGDLEKKCIQPKDQNAQILALFDVSAIVSRDMARATSRVLQCEVEE